MAATKQLSRIRHAIDSLFIYFTSTLSFIKPRLSNFLNIINNKIPYSSILNRRVPLIVAYPCPLPMHMSISGLFPYVHASTRASFTCVNACELSYISDPLCCKFNERFLSIVLTSLSYQTDSRVYLTFTMELRDLFYYDRSWRIIICKQCNVAPQTNIAQHIRQHHNSMRAFKAAAIKLVERSFDHLPLIRDSNEISRNVRPLPTAHPIQFLSIFHDGICCLLSQDDRHRYVCRGRTAIEDHLKKVHKQPLRQPEHRRRGEVGGIKGLAQAGLVRTPVAYQTLFHGSRRRYFMVKAYGVNEQMGESPCESETGSVTTKTIPVIAQAELGDLTNL